MREIKFRIWNVSAKKMWGWDLMVRNSIFALDSKLPSCEDFVALPKQNESHIWMQYTGLKDKNGKEIFEGDVIKYCYHVDTKETHFYATIVWYNGIIEVGWEHDNILWAGFAAKGDNGEQYKGDDRYYYKEIPNIPDIEIIGNVYENPELLGGVK